MGDDDLAGHLTLLGLTPEEAGTYLAMLRTGLTSPLALAEHLGRPSGETARCVGRLIEVGLASALGSDGVSAVPVDPTIAWDHLTHTRAAELELAHASAVNAYRDYRRSVSPQSTEDLVEVITGPRIADRILRVEGTADSQVLRFDSPPYHIPAGANPTELDNLARGVEYRVVYSKSAVQNRSYYASNIQPCIAAGEHARVLPTVPVKLTVFDRRLAIVSMSFVEAEVNDSLLVVRPSSLLSALAGLFEAAWRAAYPMHVGDRVPLSLRPLHLRILELLGTGVSDDTVAQLLGISRRTLSRNLEQLNHQAGTSSRFQLALYAVRNGWI
ncbi:helix-turn-helix transcriptional regulator [Streptomyces sp. LP11]|uniref:Helix-turn-helix transcriptional regulator n=1 Tax=Streptomyces pyxinicus TaxID=2970331 RepID=A0ABT2B500_9ACTN|nr:helix-turn-helix transcriptional regulator [Streptomyces sp. LP11]MCS0603598.1 helix-turn-helix transcriptional regulator [Streptomyces sp. LP11]